MPKLTSARPLVLLALLCCLSNAALAGAHNAAEPMDHSAHQQQKSHEGHEGHEGHDMAGHSAERDELGRRLFGMKHNVTPEIADQLRERIRGWDKISDEEIALSMNMMGSNYEWFISDGPTGAKTGVLIMLHGFRERGDKIFTEQVRQYADIFPTALAFGMSMMMSDHIQLAVNDIVDAGAERIVVIPIVSTEHNTMIRQWHYIFGLRDEPSYAAVKQIETDAEIIFADPPGDDPAVAEILLDFADEISEDPSNEVVIIAAHGPSEDDDNRDQLKLMSNLARMVKEDGGYADVIGMTLQDDAPAEVREANVALMRDRIEAAKAEGQEVLVVTNLIGARTIQGKLRKDLKGLDYKFNAKGLVQHDELIEWIGETIRGYMENIQDRAAMNN